MIFGGYLIEFGEVAFEVIKDRILDYINYKKAQIREWKYDHTKFCGIVRLADEETLESMVVISEFQKKKRELKERLRENYRRQLNDLASFRN